MSAIDILSHREMVSKKTSIPQLNLAESNNLVIREQGDDQQSVLGLGSKTSISVLLGLPKDLVLRKAGEKTLFLNRLHKILCFSRETIDQFTAGRIDQFDPHVGETNCQVRAFMVARLFLALEKDIAIYEYYEQLFWKLELAIKEILASPVYLRDRKHWHIDGFLEKHGLSLDINPDIAFLILSRFLTFYGNRLPEGFSDNIDFIALKNDFAFSLSRARKMVRRFQIRLSAMSCMFQEFIADSVISKSSHKFFLGQKQTVVGRQMYPVFLGFNLMFEDLRKTGAYIVVTNYLHTNEGAVSISQVFKLRNNRVELIPDDQHKDIRNYPAVTFRGFMRCENLNVSEAKLRFFGFIKEYGVDYLIKAGMAAHPQFSGVGMAAIQDKIFPSMADFEGDAINFISEYSKEYTAYKKFAVQYGCDAINQSLFVIRHIHAEIISRALQTAAQKIIYPHEYCIKYRHSKVGISG